MSNRLTLSRPTAARTATRAMPRHHCRSHRHSRTACVNKPDSVAQAKLLIPRVKYWLDLYKVYGMATESSINVLHYPDIFLIGLSGGSEPGDHRGLYAGNTTAVAFPDNLADNTTVLAFLGYRIPSTTISFGSIGMTTFTLFAAS